MTPVNVDPRTRTLIPAGYDGPSVGDSGERGVIETIMAIAPSSRNGDDAAVLAHLAPNSRAVVTTDMLVEGRHFRLDWSSGFDIGAKAVVANLADIQAMGARPTAVLLALGAPDHTPISLVEDLVAGMNSELKLHNVELVGGDVVSSDGLVVSITAVGTLGGNLPAMTLSGARPGQKLVAAGRIGDSAAGLALLQRYGPSAYPERFDCYVNAHRRPHTPPMHGVIARAAGATAMTDTSDSLYSDCAALAHHSGVSITLFSQALDPPLLMREAAELLGVDPWEWVLGGGEDHALLATTNGAVPSGFRVIGEVAKAKKGQPVTVDTQVPMVTDGWDSFPRASESR